MAQAFNLTAQLNLRGPSNVRTIVSNIRRQLGTINTNVTVSVSANSTRSITTLNRTLSSLNSTLTTTTTNVNNVTAAINNLGQAIAGAVSSSNNLSTNVANAATATNTLANNTARVNQQLAPAATEMQEFGRQSALAIRRFAAFSTATAVVFGLNNAIRQGFDAFLSFDKELVRLQQVTGKSSEGLQSLSNTIGSLSTGLGVASSDLINVATTFAQAGLSARDTERALRSLALSALAPSFDDMNKTVEGSIALMRQFNVSAADLEKALGSVNAVSAAFAVEAADLIAAIQRTGGVFASASKGVSTGTDALNEFLAVFTSVRQTTRESAETIATGLRTIFTRIQRGSTIEALKEYGVTLTDAEGKFVGAYKAVQLLSDGLSKLDPRDLRFSQIVEELGGFRQIGKVIPLIQQFAVSQNALKVAQQGQDSLAEDAAVAQLSLANQISKVREEFLALIRDISGTDSFKSIVSGALQLTSAMIKVADSVKGVIPVLGVMLAFKGASALRQFGRGFRERLTGNAPRGNSSGGRILGFNRGGVVPGEGNKDSVSAMLTPGEFVVNKAATAKAGIHNLKKLNNGGDIQRFKTGSSGSGVSGRSKQDTIGKIVKPSTNIEQSHVGDFVRLSPKQIKSALSKTKNKKIHFKIEELLGTPRADIDSESPYIDSSRFISQLSDREISFLAQEMGLDVQRNIKLNLPASYNQALRRGNPDLVSKQQLIRWVSTNKSVTDPLPKPLQETISGQWLSNKIKRIRPAKPASQTYKTPAYDVDAELNDLGDAINQQYIKSGIDSGLTFKFRGASKKFYRTIGGYSEKTGGRQDSFNMASEPIDRYQGGLAQRFMSGSAGGVKKKSEPFGTGETKFPRRITNAYAKQLIKEQQEAEWKTLATNVPTDERITIDDQAIASRMSEPFDRAAFLTSFKGKVKRDSLFKSIGDFAKFIGLPQEDLSVALPEQIDFGNAGSIGRKVIGGGLFNDSPLGSRGSEGWDLSTFGYTDKDKQDLFGYEKLVEEKKKLQDKILKTPVETFDDGSFSYDREAFVSVFDEIKTLQKKISDIKGKERRAIEAAVESKKQKMSSTGRGSISLGTAFEKPGQDVLYHELTHQLFSGLRARSAESFAKYKERVDYLFNTDNDGLADAFDALSSGNSGGYTSADVVYGRKYKQSLLESAQIQNIRLRDNPEKRNPELEKELASYIKASDGARKAREYKPINPGVNKTLLSSGFEQAHIARTEDNGKEEFLTTLVQKAPALDNNLQSVLDSTLTELLGSAGIKRQQYKDGGAVQRFAEGGQPDDVRTIKTRKQLKQYLYGKKSESPDTLVGSNVRIAGRLRRQAMKPGNYNSVTNFAPMGDEGESIELDPSGSGKVVDDYLYYSSGGAVQNFMSGGVAQRRVGYIDYDVIANPANEVAVAKGMASTGVKGPRLYADKLTELAVSARKSASIDKLRAIYGVAGSGKTTLARGQGTDDAKLRKTERFPILTPEDIQRANEILILSSSVSNKKMDEFFGDVDRAYTLSSTTKAERDNVRSQRASRDATGIGLEGRTPGATSSVAADTAVGEALLGDRLGDKSVVLGRTQSGKLRQKKGDELVETIKKKIGFTWGGFSPMTAGHESIMDAAAAMGIPPEDFIYLVGANEAIKAGDPSTYRTAIFDQDARVMLAKAGAGAKGATILPKPRDFEVPQAFDISPETGRRKVLLPGKGSTTFVADKTPEQTAKYKDAGYKVANIERTEGISGTMVRDLIAKGDLGSLKNVLSPGVYDLISKNIGQIQNRANILPSIIEQVERTQGAELDDIAKQIKSVGISRIDKKKMSDPEYAAKVATLEELRDRRDKIKSSASFTPYKLLEDLARSKPEKYGLKFVDGGWVERMKQQDKEKLKKDLEGLRSAMVFAGDTGAYVPSYTTNKSGSYSPKEEVSSQELKERYQAMLKFVTGKQLKPLQRTSDYDEQELLDAVTYYQGGSGPLARAMVNKDFLFIDREEEYFTDDVVNRLNAAAQYNAPEKLYSGLGRGQFNEILSDTKIKPEALTKNPSKTVSRLAGKIVDFPTFLSTSTNASVAESFIGKPGALMSIDASKSKQKVIDILQAKQTTSTGSPQSRRLPGIEKIDPSKLASYDAEDEVVLNPNTRFKIKSARLRLPSTRDDEFDIASAEDHYASMINDYSSKGANKKKKTKTSESDLTGIKLDLAAQMLNQGGMIQKFSEAGAVKETKRIRDRVSALAQSKQKSIQETLIEQLKGLGGPAGVRKILGIGSGDSLTRSVLNANNIKANKGIETAKDYVNRALFTSGKSDAAEAKRIAGLTQVAIAGLLPMGYSDTNEWQLPESGKTIFATIKGFNEKYLSAAQQMSRETAAAARNLAENMQYIDIFDGGKLAFDFDETLVAGANILNDKGRPDIAKYADRTIVDEHLKKGRLTRLGEKLKTLIQSDPEFIKNTRILTARPASTVDLLAQSLQRFGLPYQTSDITGVGGIDVDVSKAKAQNLAKAEKLIDDSLDNIRAVQKSKKSGFLYTEPQAKPELDELMGQGNIEGAVIEKALAILGANLPSIETLEANRAIDFPGGLGRAAQFFGLPSNIPTEIKRTLNGSSFEKARGEFDRYYKEQAVGLASGGMVPALVSNGEAYVPPKLAKRIGYSNLNRMNQADRNGMGKFSNGGISVFKGPGTGTSDSIPANLPVGSFIIREKATKALGLNSGGRVRKFAKGSPGGVGDIVGAKAIGLGSGSMAQKAFSLLDKTIFAFTDKMIGSKDILERTYKSYSLISKYSPDLALALQKNQLAYKRSNTSQEAVIEAPYKLIKAYEDQIQLLQASSASKKQLNRAQKQLNRALETYTKSLQNNTDAKNAMPSFGRRNFPTFTAGLSAVGGLFGKKSTPSATATRSMGLGYPGFLPQTTNSNNDQAEDGMFSKMFSRLGKVSTGISFALPMAADMFSNQDPKSADEAYSSTAVQSGATAVGTAMMTAQMVGAINPVLGVLTGIATLGYGVMKAFADAEEAARKFKIDKAQKDIEKNGEDLASVMKEIGESSKATPDQLAKLNASLEKSVDAALSIVNESGVGTKRGTVVQPLVESILGFKGGGGEQGAANRSIILQEKGTLAYLSALGSTNNELKLMQSLLPKMAAESSKQFKIAGQQVEDVLTQRLRSGESISDIIAGAGFDKQAEILARSNTAVQEQLLSIQSDTRLSQQERDARTKNIIALEGNRIALEKAKQVQLEMALKDLEGATNKLSYSVRRVFANMNDAIASSVLSLKELDSSLQNTSGALAGNAKSSSGAGINRVIEILQSPRGFDQNQRSQAFSTASSSFGAFGSQLNKVLEIGATLEDSVLGTINRTIAGSNKDSTNEAVGSQVGMAVQKQLKDIGLPPGLSDKLSAEIGRQVSELRKSGDTNIDFADLVEKIPQLGQALDLVKDTTSALVDRMKFLQNAFGQLAEATNKIVDLQIESNNRFTSSQKALIDGNIALREALGQNVSLQERAASIRLSTTNMTGGQTDPVAIRRNIERLNQDRDNNIAAKGQAEAAGDIKAVLDFENSIRQSNIAINENVSALKAMADNSELASAALSQLQKAQERQRAGTSVLERLVTSTPQQLNELNRSAARLSANMSGIPVMGTTSEQRSQDLELFNMIAPLLGDAANPLKANVLQSMLQQSGVGMTPMFQQILDTMRNPQADPQQAEAIRVYNEAITAQSAANTELAKLNNTLANRIADETSKAIVNAINSAKVRFDDKQLADILNNINNPGADQPPAPGAPAQGKARGGLIYRAFGGKTPTIFKPKGTDTVPAMLTPGEFVVNRSATQKNLPLLKSINNGYSNGGKVEYKSSGGMIGKIKTDWAKETDPNTQKTNDKKVSDIPLPYINPQIFDPVNIRYLQKYIGGYVANFASKKNYTEDIIGMNAKEQTSEDIQKKIKNAEVDYTDQLVKEWVPGRGPMINSRFQRVAEYGWFDFVTDIDKFPKFFTDASPSVGGSESFVKAPINSNGTWGGGLPTDNIIGNPISNNKIGLTGDRDIKTPALEDLRKYSKSAVNVSDPMYSIGKQLATARSLLVSYKALQSQLESVQTNNTASGGLPGSALTFRDKNFSFANPPARMVNPNTGTGQLPDVYALSPSPDANVAETMGRSNMLGGSESKKGDLAIDDFPIVGPNPQYLLKDPSVFKTAVGTGISSLEDAIAQYKFLYDKPDFFQSISGAKATESQLEQQLKMLAGGGFGNIFVKVPKSTLNDKWQSKVGDDMAIYIETISDKWQDQFLNAIKDPTKGLEFANLKFSRNPADFANVDGESYAWSSLGASSKISNIFKGIADTESRKGLENIGDFKVGPKQLQSFDTGIVANKLLDGLGTETIKGIFNAQEISIPQMNRANGYIPDLGNKLAGVVVSNGYESGTKLNPFINTDLANKELFFGANDGGIEKAKTQFKDYYQQLVNSWDQKAKAVNNELGLAGLNAMIKPQGDISFLPKGQQDLAREKIALGPQFLGKSLSDIVGPLLSQTAGQIEAGPSADVNRQIPFTVETVNKIIQGIIQPVAKNIIAVGGKLSPLRDIGSVGTYAQSILQGANFIGSKVNNISSPFARTYGQLSALGNILMMASKGDITGINRSLGLNIDPQNASVDNVSSLISAIRSYGEFITEQGKLSFGGNAQALGQNLDKNLTIPNTQQTIAELFKSGKVELSEVDAATGKFKTTKASEAQAPQTVLDVGKMVLNPYNIFPDTFRNNLTDGLTRVLQQAGYANAIAPINSIADYLSQQDAYLNSSDAQALNPAENNNSLATLNKQLLLLTGGAFGLIPDKDRLDAIKATRTAKAAEQQAQIPQNKARGGLIYASNGTLVNFAPKGTDTVPAMLTPGEFVVNRSATQKHLPVLKAINNGNYNRGGIVNYLNNGGIVVPKYFSGGGVNSGGNGSVTVAPIKVNASEAAKQIQDSFNSAVDVFSQTLQNFGINPESLNILNSFSSVMKSLINNLSQINITPEVKFTGRIAVDVTGAAGLSEAAESLVNDAIKNALQRLSAANDGSIQLPEQFN